MILRKQLIAFHNRKGMVYMAEILMVVVGATGAGLVCFMIWWLLGIL